MIEMLLFQLFYLFTQVVYLKQFFCFLLTVILAFAIQFHYLEYVMRNSLLIMDF